MANARPQVIVITGANTGVGKETAKILYSKNAKVYVMCRSEEKTAQAIESIKAAVPNSTGDLIYQHLDLSDLSSVKAAAEGFLSKEKELHLLINNAGVAFIRGRETKQGIEMHLGTNCVGPFLLTKLLVPTMEKTAANSPPASVRVLSTSSCNVLAGRPTKFMANIPKLKKKLPSQQYINSKVGNYLHAAEWARHLKSSGIVSLSLNPGNLDSDLYRDIPSIARWFIKRTFLFPQLYGAYPTLWAALAPEVTMEQSGRYGTYPPGTCDPWT